MGGRIALVEVSDEKGRGRRRPRHDFCTDAYRAGATTTRFAYDRLDAIAEYDGANALQRRFVHGPVMDEPIVWYEGSGTTDRRFLGADERGSIISVSDGTGAMLNLNRYDEYGKPQATNAGRFQYTGQMWLGEVGVYYYKARMYSPTFGGRFLQTDPIGYEDGINLYAYVRNDPVNFVDPLGLSTGGICQNSSCTDLVVSGGLGFGIGGGFGAGQYGGVAGEPGMETGPINIRTPLHVKIGPLPPPPKTKKLSQCIQDFMNENSVGFDWSTITVSSADPLPGADATNWGTVINAGSGFDTFESDKAFLFHELAHSPQRASGDLTTLGYMGSMLMAGLRSLGQARMGRGFQSQREMHRSIPIEQEANRFRDALLKAYEIADKPCDE